MAFRWAWSNGAGSSAATRSPLRIPTIAILILALFAVGLVFPDVPGGWANGVTTPAAWVAEDPGASLDVQQVHEGAIEFQPLPLKPLSLGASGSAFWLRVRIDNPTPQPIVRWLTVGIARLHHVSVFEHIDGAWTARHSGMAHPFVQRDAPTTTPVFSFDLPAQAAHDIYVRIASETLLLVRPQLWEPVDFVLAEDRQTRQEYFGAGITALALLLGVLLAAILRESSFLILGLMALAYLLFRWSASGLAFAELWPDSPQWAVRSIGFFTAALGFLLTLLHRRLLETRRLTPYGDRALAVLCAGFVVLALALLVTPHRHAMQALMLWGLLLSITSPIIGYLCWQRGAPLFGYFFAGYALPWHFIELQYFASLGWFPTASGWLIGYNRAWALLLSATIVLIALGTRIVGLRRAREAAKRKQFAELEATVALRTAEMREARELAEQALADQRRLLTMASHEFRAPLASIGAAAQLLELDCAPDKRQVLGRITRATARLKHFLDNCLTGERLASTGWTLHESRVSLANLLGEVVEEIGRTTSTHRIILEPVPQDLAVTADPHLLRVQLANLIENAAKYSPHGTEIVLRVRRDGAENLVICILDQGPGIAPEDLPYLFDKFYRSERVGSISGSGLGLYVAQRIAHLHGGDLLAREAPGGGAQFDCVLPKERICS